ncbi:MAG: 16S rRNA (cytidine(1402)-2'-O)-methyltransferase [Gammaproteobacteria bacterium]|nr:16S rRNA (cytidine(1402)-2'-O)-methyltransferase [Gammaproteobacteria bacterium]MDH3447236.1 16S rRNA (cytidine(1402)-2'-O)-methyltransferase [Gammaproteobacteria bacterium]
MPGVLYIVATPIGNLDDISLRAIATLKAVDVIAAEDTRHSRQLLNHLGIATRMISCHEHNEEARAVELVEILAAGSDVALISDAGTPLISDPGYRLVRAARQRGIRVTPIPGASSLIAALSAAGLPTDSFHFGGFLSAKPGERGRQLEAMRDLHGTLAIFESGHRIDGLLRQLAQIFSENQCVVAKELSKLHEQFLQGEPAQLLQRFADDPRLGRGEFVVLIDNPANAADREIDDDEVKLLQILLDEVSVKMAVKIAMRLTGKKKNEIYQQALRIHRGDRPGGNSGSE